MRVGEGEFGHLDPEQIRIDLRDQVVAFEFLRAVQARELLGRDALLLQKMDHKTDPAWAPVWQPSIKLVTAYIHCHIRTKAEVTIQVILHERVPGEDWRRVLCQDTRDQDSRSDRTD